MYTDWQQDIEREINMEIDREIIQDLVNNSPETIIFKRKYMWTWSSEETPVMICWIKEGF